MSIQDMEDMKQQYLFKMKSLINEFPIKDYRVEKIDIKINELKENFNGMSIEINKKKKIQQLEQVASPSRFFNSFCYDDDDDDDDKEYTIAITPVLPTEKPDNSLSMRDEHHSTILEMESDEVIKSSVEDLVPIPSESEGISDSMCDVPFFDDDSFEDIDYVEASPPDYELVSLEENDNPTPDCMLKSPSTFPIPVEDSDSFFKKSGTSLSYSDNSLPEFETFSDHTEKTSSGSTTTHADNSLPEYDSFLFETELDQGESTSVVIEDILGEPRVYVPNVLPTHTTLMLNSDFIPSDDSLGSDLGVSFPSGTRNKIFDPGIFFEDCPDFEASRARSFVLHSLELQHPQLHIGNPIS
ncbi:hypothetical protein Tco_1011267 [Tanacetum coccineum]